MKDSYLTAEELVQDDSFLHWVKYGNHDEKLDKKWTQWLKQNPEKQDIVEEAMRIINAISGEKQYFPSELKRQKIWERIDSTVSTVDSSTISKKFSWFTLRVAAAIVVTVILGLWTVYNYDRFGFAEADDTGKFSLADQKHLLKFTNSGNQAHTIQLADNSKIILQPKSTILYPGVFTGSRRQVLLRGEAFFEVAHDSERPFSVYTNDLVTQVLGTSFNIRAYDSEENIVVAVKTGKVSIFKESIIKAENDIANGPEGSLLTPNQQITFIRQKSTMVKSLVENPEMVSSSIQARDFQFKDAPLHDVFSLLEEAYEVKIDYDEQALSNCYLHASLENVPFYDKLTIICEAINSQYEILDAHIVISGNGCN
jgi:transmembrane sensor